jgi:3',5'-cyclic AMP phosphodiesterase CpdA
MPQFRLLHAADLHFYRFGEAVAVTDYLASLCCGARVPGHVNWVSGHADDVADALAEFAYTNRDRYDAIVLSGDLGTTGAFPDLLLARHFVTAAVGRDYRSLAGYPTLAASGKEVLVIPGNHDRFGPPLHLFPPGDTQFDQVFGGYWTARQGAQQFEPLTKDDATLVLVGADLTLDAGDSGDWAGVGHLGRGRAYPRRVARLLQLTEQAQARHGPCVVLWVIHFEPRAQDELLSLLDEQALASALRRTDVAAVLCGHTHLQSREKRFADTRFFVCGTSTQHYAPVGNYLQLIEIDVAPGSARPMRIDFTSYSFQRRPGQSGFFEDL